MTKSMQIPEKRIDFLKKSREISRNLLEAFLRSRKEENLYGHCDVNNARRNSLKGLYNVKGLLVLVKKASFSTEFRLAFHSGGEGEAVVESLIDFICVLLEFEGSK